jgi:hypothetical protein
LTHSTLRHAAEANASTSMARVMSWPSTVWVVFTGIQSLRRSRLARMNSTASSTLRSAVVGSRSSESTSVNSADRCER